MAERPGERPLPRVLEPCACCGGLGVPGVAIRNEVVHGWVQCADCGHRTPADLSYVEALESWNRGRAAGR
jgi:transcription elongation factor Elf1